MNILLLDDEQFMLKILSRQLANLGFKKITPISNPIRALLMLEQGDEIFNLLLLDLQMPGIDGVEFIRHLDRVRYTGGLILISGEDERILQTAKRLAEAHKLQVLGALRKPVTPDQLKAVLKSAPKGSSRAPGKIYDAKALQKGLDNRELVNYYQPQVELVSGRLCGVESLVRWQHPEDGLVFPDQFIDTAEEHNLIDALTGQVLDMALQQAARWLKSELSLQVAVNISMDNLANLDFADEVAFALERANVPHSSLVLEVTESRLMKNPLAPLDILTRLRLKHIGLSIDDFGTGHSSLAQLRDIPFDELKIDRGFIHGAYREEALRAIVEASLGMAKHLRMKTVAEGIEDQSDWDLIQSMGCDYAQGYFIAKPMPAEQLEHWITEWEVRRHNLIPVVS
ncbi:EAL domain-containing protein [Sedimenticola thiotaurini]|uniref:Histidine kinase n=1 Tax=Sedimenticola thiotaurini TaxID=1543721 RepID=A0A0F7JWR0_9GAMM|nr:EAL domain-containing response regulator [Sedimenticola thiotaurini]AKH19190.1 histidine kinase [Sedimenticola thiotaurini]